MREAGIMLERALRDRGPCRIVMAQQRPWASVTFSGARHRLRLALPWEGADRFLDGIEEAAFDLGEHLLADLVVMERTANGQDLCVRIEALTIEEGRSERAGGTRCGTKRGRTPLAGA